MLGESKSELFNINGHIVRTVVYRDMIHYALL